MKKILLFFAIVSVAGMLASCNGNGKTAEAASEGTATEENAEDVGFLQGFAYVDLGLSVNWATCNVGANAPEEYGNKYGWGETSAKESDFDFDNKYEVDEEWTKYNYTDSLTTLDKDDDVATSNWGTEWRMPTKDEMQELVDKCTWTIKDNKGFEVKGPNGKTIFLPINDDLSTSHCKGNYWTSSCYENCFAAYELVFHTKFTGLNSDSRGHGKLVRPVCAK